MPQDNTKIHDLNIDAGQMATKIHDTVMAELRALNPDMDAELISLEVLNDVHAMHIAIMLEASRRHGMNETPESFMQRVKEYQARINKEDRQTNGDTVCH